MPVLRVNATHDTAVLHQSPQAASVTLQRAARGTGPIVILIHGYKYLPNSTAFCPHGTLFRPGTGWPDLLGIGTGITDGLAIAFGWNARGPFWQAYRNAAATGVVLAGLITKLHTAAPHRPIHLISHSLGSEVALSALTAAPARSIGKVLLLAGASYQSRLVAAARSPAGQTCKIYNITSAENRIFDFTFERLIAPETPADHAIGRGLNLPNLTTLRLDCAVTLARLRAAGVDIAAPQRRICHWSTYTRPGAMALYADILRSAENPVFDLLKAPIPAPARSKSHIFARLRLAAPLPLDQKA